MAKGDLILTTKGRIYDIVWHAVPREVKDHTQRVDKACNEIMRITGLDRWPPTADGPIPGFEPLGAEEQARAGSMLAVALAHARRGLGESTYAHAALTAVVYYLEQVREDADDGQALRHALVAEPPDTD